MLLTKTVKLNWHPKIKKHYEEKEYIYTKMGDEFEVKVEDLTKGSNVKVLVKCDCEDCKQPYLKPMPWKRYNNYIHEDGKYYCVKCVKKLYSVEKQKITKLKNSISFYDWCYNNLSKEEADIIMLRWDYDKNIDNNGNIISPKFIGFSSNGFNRKGYWFKCLEYPEHKSELKNINTFINGIGSIKCIKCNTIHITHPEFCIFIVNKEDTYKYSHGSNEKILMRCPYCGLEKKISLNTLINSGFGCLRCSDKIPYSEKFVFKFLEQLLNDDFQTQLSKKYFKWCNKYKYDFYTNKINGIIETHGEQHYKEGFERIKSSSRHIKTLKEVQENDKIKQELAKNNDIKNYIILDCRYSELEWIKNSIIQSKLPKLLNFKEYDIDWLKCHEYACSNLVKKVCDLWNSGIKSAKEIAKLLKRGKSSIIRFLKQGVELNWCNYNPNISFLKVACKKVICLNTNEIFNSITEASKIFNTYKTCISACCKGKQKSAGKLEDGTKLKWMYYDEYLKTIS